VTSDWVIPTVDDVQKLLASVVVNAVNELDSGGVNVLDGPNGILAMVVNQVRGEMASANRVPLSLKKTAVPPEAVKHVLILCVEALMVRQPQMVQFTNSEQMGWTIKASRDWLKTARETGSNFSTPSDPDPDTEPTGPVFGSFVDAFQDLTIDGPPTA
jgi:hypothetical protein